MSTIRKLGVLLLALIILFGLAGHAPAQAVVYPGDGLIEHIRFLPDGVEVKLTPAGIVAGGNANALVIANRVKTAHERILRGPSPINPAKLAVQIVGHAQLYLWAATLPPRLRDAVRLRANPINVTWPEIR